MKKNEPPPSRREQFLEAPLPHSEESEKLILGGIILSNGLAGEVFAKLKPEDFYNPTYRRIAAAMQNLMKHGTAINPILIGEELKKDGDVRSIGGVAAITNLTSGLPRFSTLEEYIKIVSDKALKRRLIRFCNEAATRVLDDEDDGSSILNNMITGLINHQHIDTNSNASLSEVAQDVKAMFDEWANGNTTASALKTGIPELDKNLRLKGLAKGELTLIAARPSTGKTALLIQIATHIARLRIPVLFTSLEMIKEKIVMRMLPAMTGIPNHAISPYIFQQGGIEREKLTRAVQSLDYPMYFDRSFQVPQFIARATHYVRRFGVQLVVFDYLTLFKTGTNMEVRDRVNAVGDIINGIKELCLTEKVAGLGAAQLSRELEKEHRRPRMTDLRDSGVIEQAADTIFFPYDPESREHSKNPDAIKDRVWLNLYCEKQRDGKRYWTVPIEYDKELQMFQSPEMSGRDAPIKLDSDNYTPPDYKDWHEDKDED